MAGGISRGCGIGGGFGEMWKRLLVGYRDSERRVRLAICDSKFEIGTRWANAKHACRQLLKTPRKALVLGPPILSQETEIYQM